MVDAREVTALRVAVIATLVVLGAVLLGGAARDRTLKSRTLKAVAAEASWVASSGLRWYDDAPGSGGWVQSAAYHPASPKYIMLGSDTSGPWLSVDGGESYKTVLNGMNNSYSGSPNYVGGILGINAPWFDGWYIATKGGIYKSSSRKAETWTLQTTSAAGFTSKENFSGYYWATAIPFDCLEWDGDDLLAAGAGWGAWEFEKPTVNWLHYPVGHQADAVTDATAGECSATTIGKTGEGWTVDGWIGTIVTITGGTGAGQSRTVLDNDEDTITVAKWDTTPSATSDFTLNSATLGTHTLWRYINGDSNGAAWRPWPGLGDQGNARSVSVAIVAGDTLAAVVCKTGLWVFDGTMWDNWATSYGWQCRALTGTWSGFGSANYTTDYRMWDCHITTRGTLYATMTQHKASQTGEPTAGCYAINILDPIEWTFIGSDDITDDVWPATNGTEARSIHEQSQGAECDAGTGDSHFIWMAVNDGTGVGPDTITLADQEGNRGVIRTQVTDITAQDQIWTPLSYAIYATPTWTTYNFFTGWQGGGYWVSDFVATYPGNANYIIADLATIQYSRDGGATWSLGSYAESGDYYTTNGQAQLCPNDAVQLDDHRVVTSAWDASVYVSDSSDLGNWNYEQPTYVVLPDTTLAADEAWTSQAFDLEVYGNYKGSGREALLAIFADDVSPGRPSRLTAWWDTDGDGDREWDALSDEIQYEPCMRLTAISVLPNGAIVVGYRRYTNGTTSGTISGGGVWQFVWNGADWDVATWNTGLPSFAYVTDFALAGGYVWASCCRNNAVNGGVYYASADGSGSWSAGTTTAADISCLGAGPAGTALYAGSFGYRASTGGGRVMVCADPATAPTTWTTIANNTTNTFGWSQYEDMRGYGTYSALAWGRYQTWVKDIEVQPGDPTHVWFALGGTPSGANLRDKCGVWLYNTSTSAWTKADADLGVDGLAANAITFIGYPSRIMLGHSCTDWQVARLDAAKQSTYNRVRAPQSAPTIATYNIDRTNAPSGFITADLSGTNSLPGCALAVKYRLGSGPWTTTTLPAAVDAAWSTTLVTTIGKAAGTLSIQVRPMYGQGDGQLIGEWYLDSVEVDF